jgi:tyrocidine synthetase III
MDWILNLKLNTKERRTDMNQQNQVTKEAFQKAKIYWQGKFTDPITPIKWPYDFPKLPNPQPNTQSLPLHLEEALTQRLLTLSRDQDVLLYVLLLAALKIYILKYLDQDDICIAAPVYTSTHQNDHESELVLFRDRLTHHFTVKEVLVAIKQTVLDAYQHQQYVIEDALDVLGVTVPLDLGSSVIFLSRNIHPQKETDALIDSPTNDIAISINRTHNNITGTIQYDGNRFKPETIKSVAQHFLYVTHQAMDNLGLIIADINLLFDHEKEQILHRFNDTQIDNPEPLTIHQLFQQQVAKEPNQKAVQFEDRQLSYLQLNGKANQLARRLQQRGVPHGRNNIVAMMMESSIETVIAILGILKAGAAYLPIEPQYPEKRKEYILKDSNINLLLLTKQQNNIPLDPDKIVILDDTIYTCEDADLPNHIGPHDLAYVIYTSGTTGRQKGVLVEHGGLVNYTLWRIHTYQFTSQDVTFQMLSYSFDGFGSNFYSTLLSGGQLVLIPDDHKVDPQLIGEVFSRYPITNISLVPAAYQMILESVSSANLSHLRFVVLAGERSPAALVRLSYEKAPAAKLLNEYGPTEATVTAVGNQLITETVSDIIGKPIANTNIYILDSANNPLATLITGEINISGTGLARGYLNNPELTATKFHREFNFPNRCYKTGDRGRWLPDGTIQLQGRKDHQVKIRGFRIELEEIDVHLLKHPDIKDAIVLALQEETQEKILCAYIVVNQGKFFDDLQLRDYLAALLPDYMIPAYYVQVDKMPLTTNNKIDRQALPRPHLQDPQEFQAPTDAIEKQLALIWYQVLGGDSNNISVNTNFFQQGGHSLKANRLVAKIHKQMNIKIPLAEMFKNPTIKGLASVVREQDHKDYDEVLPAETKEYYPLSSAQRRIFIEHQLDSKNLRFNVATILVLEGIIDLLKLEDTFKKVVHRHEGLRTAFMMVESAPVQIIRQEVPFKIVRFDDPSGDPKSLIRDFIKPFNLAHPPLFRVTLIKQAKTRHILVVDMHHSVNDGVSQDVLIRDFSRFYNGDLLPPLPLQYKDYSQWQNSPKQHLSLQKQEAYWLQQFAGNIPSLDLPTDYPRPETKRFEGASLIFTILPSLTQQLDQLRDSTNTTLFQAMLSIFVILLARYAGQEDIVIGSPVSGRRHIELQDIMGMFVNMLAIRTQPLGHKTYDSFLTEVKTTITQAIENQDYQFEDLIIKLNLQGNPRRNPLFDVVFEIHDFQQGNSTQNATTPSNSTNSGLKISPYQMEATTSVFDLILTAEPQKDSIKLKLRYCTALFTEAWCRKMSDHYIQVLEQVTENRHIRLQDIHIQHDLIKINTDMRSQDNGDFGF